MTDEIEPKAAPVAPVAIGDLAASLTGVFSLLATSKLTIGGAVAAGLLYYFGLPSLAPVAGMLATEPAPVEKVMNQPVSQPVAPTMADFKALADEVNALKAKAAPDQAPVSAIVSDLADKLAGVEGRVTAIEEAHKKRAAEAVRKPAVSTGAIKKPE